MKIGFMKSLWRGRILLRDFEALLGWDCVEVEDVLVCKCFRNELKQKMAFKAKF